MDWQQIKQAICDGRQFTETLKGRSVVADTIMPSGHIIKIFMQADHAFLTLHDNGAAFDELAAHGREVSSMRGVRRMLEEVNLRIDDFGVIFMDRLDPGNVAVGISVLADASLRAAQYMIAHSKGAKGPALDRQLQDALRMKFPEGRANVRFTGLNRQHRFDFGFPEGDKTVLVDAVVPDATAVNAAVVKTLDVLRADDNRARPILVYDRRDGWGSDLLNLLTMGGGEYVSIDAVNAGHLLAA